MPKKAKTRINTGLEPLFAHFVLFIFFLVSFDLSERRKKRNPIFLLFSRRREQDRTILI
jgi:hypothetical protein